MNFLTYSKGYKTLRSTMSRHIFLNFSSALHHVFQLGYRLFPA